MKLPHENDPTASSESPSQPGSPSSNTPETLAAWEAFETTGNIVDLLKHAIAMERQRNDLAAKFTKLDKPKYADFQAWVATLPPTYWTRYDLSAARIGWEAGYKFILENVKDVAAAGKDAQPNQTASTPSPRSAC